VGADGWRLLDALDAPATPSWLRELPAVQTLRRVWAQQYHPREPRATRRSSSKHNDIDNDDTRTSGPGGLPDEEQDGGPGGESDGRWRAKEELAPSSQLQNSPYDPDARYGKKRETSWVGYKLHVTETCAPDAPHLIVHVATTPACVADAAVLAPIHEHLADRRLLPERQLVDAGYVDAEVLSASKARFGVEVLGPTRGNFRWQARAQTGFEGHRFTVDWVAKQVICPQGHASRSWTPMQDRRHVHTRDMITVAFSVHECRPCPSRSQCTRSAYRTLTLHPREQEQALRAARVREQTDDFKLAYACRAGVEGTHSQAVRVCGLRRSRYIGQPKTHLQHILSAVAINLLRLNAWLNGTPLAPTRQSSFARLMAQAA